LADELEAAGYDGLATRLGIEEPTAVVVPDAVEDDPFAEPGF
jgi:hypothetical protein